MTAILIVPPTVLPVTLAAAKANMRIDDDALDALIPVWIAGITAKLEHEIGQCLMEQTWEVSLDRFPSVELHTICTRVPEQAAMQIVLPHPVLRVESVSYLDAAGEAQVLAPTAYKLRRSRYSSALHPAGGNGWPAAAADGASILVKVVCGYGTAPAATPPNVQLYILAKLVEQFDPATRMERDTVQSVFVEQLLDGCRSYA